MTSDVTDHGRSFHSHRPTDNHAPATLDMGDSTLKSGRRRGFAPPDSTPSGNLPGSPWGPGVSPARHMPRRRDAGRGGHEPRRSPCRTEPPVPCSAPRGAAAPPGAGSRNVGNRPVIPDSHPGPVSLGPVVEVRAHLLHDGLCTQTRDAVQVSWTVG